MKTAPLLLEIGCEEIPARMIAAASRDLRRRVVGILDEARLVHGSARAWGGPRRLAVRVEDVAARQDDRAERVTGPPVQAAFDASGAPTAAALGFARKQGVEPARLERMETDRGVYAGFVREVPGLWLGELLARELPVAVGGMAFPKTMRWAAGHDRWVRPVHWLLGLHGEHVLDGIELFGIRSGDTSHGHRFLSDGAVRVRHPDAYAAELERACVLVDPRERAERIEAGLRDAAGRLEGRLVEDPALLAEAADLVEWPAVVEGAFDPRYLELPREILVTTLRYHQKCFSVEDARGNPLPAFLAVANTDRDPGGHVRRGNEWVVGGRLEDARFFWSEDRGVPLAERSAALAGVAFHAKAGSYADRAERIAGLARGVVEAVERNAARAAAAGEAGRLAKNDLVTGTVGEFPELQGIVGGLLLREEGVAEDIWKAVYDHYRPAGADDRLPGTVTGCAVALADKLDAVATLIAVGESPSGSRDPFGLRRASNGIFRIVIERGWPLSLEALRNLAGGGPELLGFLAERVQGFLRERGYSTKEIRAALRPDVSESDAYSWDLGDVVARLDALATVREREDFTHLADMTKRVDNILIKGSSIIESAAGTTEFEERSPEALALDGLVRSRGDRVDDLAAEARYADVIDTLAEFIDPVDRFFDRVLVLDPEQPGATRARAELLGRVRGVLTRCFDIRELAGEAGRKG